jgi:hypothetical protein
MQTNSYANWMTRPLSAVCPTPDVWPCEEPLPAASRRSSPERQREPGAAPEALSRLATGTDKKTYASMEEYMNEQKLRILKMLEDGKVTADEAARLMEALDKTESRPKESDIRRKWLHIRVQENGRDTVNMKVPLALLKFGFKLAPKAARHHVANARRSAERARERAERARERAENQKEKAVRRAQRTAERMRQELAGKLGDHPGMDVDEVVNKAVRESMEEVEQAIQEELREAEEALEKHSMRGLDVLASKDFDLDLDQILEMAQADGFDGKIIDIHDEEDDEHVTITLE